MSECYECVTRPLVNLIRRILPARGNQTTAISKEAFFYLNWNKMSLLQPSSLDAQYSNYIYIRTKGLLSSNQDNQLCVIGVTFLETLATVRNKPIPI